MAKVKVIPRIPWVELPTGWFDESVYSFSSQDRLISLSISREEIKPQQRMDEILEQRRKRFEDGGPVEVMEKREFQVDGQQAGMIRMAVNLEGGKPTQLAYLLIIRFGAQEAWGALMNAQKDTQQRLDEAWNLFVNNLKFQKP